MTTFEIIAIKKKSEVGSKKNISTMKNKIFD